MDEANSKIRALVVDDEPFARERVRRLLNREAEIEIVGEAGDGLSAVAEIRTLKPDLVFLDVQMPGKNGFEVLESLKPEEMPIVVFLTAFDQYAVRAFDSAALDYVLKPFDEERFFKAVARAKRQLQQTGSANETESQTEAPTGEAFDQPQGFLERVLVKQNGRVYFFKTDEIEWIEAEGNYVRLHFANAVYALRETLTNLETRLNSRKFARVHRSGLVNLAKIRELVPVFGGRANLILESGATLDVSRRYNSKFAQLLSQSGR